MKPTTDEALSRARANTAQAEANRRAMPYCTSVVDDHRAHFEGCRIVYMRENGRQWRTPSAEEGVQAVSFAVPAGEGKRLTKPVTRYVEAQPEQQEAVA